MTKEQLKELLKEHNTTQADLARAFGVSRNMICTLVNSKGKISKGWSMLLENYFEIKPAPTLKH